MLYQPGEILSGSYRIEKLIGQGGFAEVYLATHLDLNVPRALKVLRRETPGVGSTAFSDFLGRFQLEAQLGARLEHPQLVRVYDFKYDQETIILVMEYCPKGSLAAVIQQARQAAEQRGQAYAFPLEAALRITLEVAQGLAVLHAQDVVHRDLKPSNILFDAQGRAKVADLGLAQIPGGPSMRSKLSQPQPHPGTASYMSPEQEHETVYLKSPSDIFALGLVLFEMLTGRNFKNQPPGARLRTLRRDAPAWLEQLLAEMLADDPKLRPWDGAVVAERLKTELARPAQAGRSAQEESAAASSQGGQAAGALPLPPPAAAAPAASQPGPWSQPWLRALAIVAGLALISLVAAIVWNPPLTAMQTASPPTNTAAPHEATQALPATQTAIMQVTAPPEITPQNTTAPIPTNPPAPTRTPTQPTGQPGMVLILAGVFQMGRDPEIAVAECLKLCPSGQCTCDLSNYEHEGPVHAVLLNDYYIDIYEVTNAQYQECVDDRACDPPEARKNDTEPPTYYMDNHENYPVTDINWENANDYCAWRSARLPTEAEWEKAARGGLEGKMFPWGDEPPACEAGAPFSAQFKDCTGRTRPVGSYPPNDYGLYDMAGNVWEWVLDWYSPTYYTYSPTENPPGPPFSEKNLRIVRGGSWGFFANYLSVAHRREQVSETYNSVGFRCAR